MLLLEALPLKMSCGAETLERLMVGLRTLAEKTSQHTRKEDALDCAT